MKANTGSRIYNLGFRDGLLRAIRLIKQELQGMEPIETNKEAKEKPNAP
jgi:hypothetical protein